MTAIVLSKKTTPLGPRQKLAYLKPFRAAVVEAKATLEAKTKAANEAEALRAKGLKRLAAPIVIVDAKGNYKELNDLSRIRCWGLKVGAKSTPAEKRAARKALLAGEVSLELAGGGPKVPAASKRIRLIAKADLAALRRVDAKIKAAEDARAILVGAMFANGAPITPEKLADALLAKAMLPDAMSGYGLDTYAPVRAQSALDDAMKHDGTKTCPCGRCSGNRSRVAQEKEWADRRAAQEKARAKAEAKRPKITFTCPECEQINEHSPVEIDDYSRPYVTCEKCESDFSEDEVPELAKPPKGQKSWLESIAA